MAIGSFIKLNRSRQSFNLRCHYITITESDEKISYQNYLGGLFYAKIESQILTNKDRIGSGFIVANNTFTISSIDDLQLIYDNNSKGIYGKIYIEQFDKVYLIRDIQREIVKQQLKLQKLKHVEAKYYISLIESQEDEQ